MTDDADMVSEGAGATDRAPSDSRGLLVALDGVDLCERVFHAVGM